MFKTFLSLISNEALIFVFLIGFGFLYLEFFPKYWLVLTLLSIVALIIVLPKFTSRFDKYDKESF